MEPKSESLADKTLEEKAPKKPEPKLVAAALLGKIFTLMKKKRELELKNRELDQVQQSQTEIKELEMKKKIIEAVKEPKDEGPKDKIPKDKIPKSIVKKQKKEKKAKKTKSKKKFGYPDGLAGFLTDATLIGALIFKHNKDAEKIEKEIADVLQNDALEKLLSNEPEPAPDAPAPNPSTVEKPTAELPVTPPDASKDEAEAKKVAAEAEAAKVAAEKKADEVKKAKEEAEVKRVKEEKETAAREQEETEKRKKAEEEKKNAAAKQIEAEQKEKQAKADEEQNQRESDILKRKAERTKNEQDKKAAEEAEEKARVAKEKSRLAQEETEKARREKEEVRLKEESRLKAAADAENKRKEQKAADDKKAADKAAADKKAADKAAADKKAVDDKAAADKKAVDDKAAADKAAADKRKLTPQPPVPPAVQPILPKPSVNPNAGELGNQDNVRNPSASRIFPKDLNNFGKNKKYGYLDEYQTYSAISKHEGGYEALYNDSSKLIPDPEDPKKQKKIRVKYNKSGPTVEEWSEANLGKKKKLTELTFTELLQLQNSRPAGQAAVGKIQFIPSTLFGKKLDGDAASVFGQSGLKWSDIFSPANQEILISTLSKQQDAVLLGKEGQKTLKDLGHDGKITPGMKLAANYIGPAGLLAIMEESKKDPTLSVAEIYKKRFNIDLTKGMTINKELAVPGSGATFLAEKEKFVLDFAIKEKYLTPEESAKTVMPATVPSGTRIDTLSTNNAAAKADSKAATSSASTTVIIQNQSNTRPAAVPAPKVDDRPAHLRK